tara:strand:+ start:2957 stop:3937 length:981 start_codon:yes stop_codon:yes gene_type:complete
MAIDVGLSDQDMADLGISGIGGAIGAGTGGSGFNLNNFLSQLGLFGGALGGGAAINSAYDRLGKIGEAAQQGAIGIGQSGLDQTRFQPFTVASTTGGNFGYDPVTGAATNTLGVGEQAFQDKMFGQAGTFFDQASGPMAGREQDVYNRIRAVQSPEEERQRMALEERLFSQGRSGVSTNQYGGTPEQLVMAKAQAEAQNSAALGAMGQAQAEQMQQANLGQNFLASSYLPQTQLQNLIQASQMFPQLQQQGQLKGAGLFGEASMGGLEALLGAGQGQANLMGQLGTGLLGGLATPTDSYGGLSDVFGNDGLGGLIEGLGNLFGIGG